jgi:hypothetical protein
MRLRASEVHAIDPVAGRGHMRFGMLKRRVEQVTGLPFAVELSVA